MPFGSPGGDQQTQAMLQVFLNMHVFAMDPSIGRRGAALRLRQLPELFLAPRVPSRRFLELEGSVSRKVATELAALGHEIEWRAGSGLAADGCLPRSVWIPEPAFFAARPTVAG